MTGRKSTRSVVARGDASSPPPDSQSVPIARRTRGRSTSAELGDDNPRVTRRGKRSDRQASVESAGSDDSSVAGRVSGPKVRGTARKAVVRPGQYNLHMRKRVCLVTNNV
jgi:hypothetical protein